MMDLISIIVPVYNTEKYLDRCIQSILSQTYTNFELLLIDDGSTDSSGAICDSYAEQDSRVRVFHKPNGGVSSVRNMGLDNAKGEWIGWVDSDDYIDAEMYEHMYNAAIQNKVDMVCCDVEIVYAKGKRVLSYNNEYEDHELMRECLVPITEVYFAMWNKLVSRNLYDVNKIRASVEASMWEDVELMTKIRFFSKSTYVINTPYYHYNKTNDSSMTNSSIIYRAVKEQVERVISIEDFFIYQNSEKSYRHFISLLKLSAKYILLNSDPYKWRKIFPEAKKSLFKLYNVFSKQEIIKFLIVSYLGDFGIFIFKLVRKLKTL